jgi:hypothetical protein
MFIDGEGSDGVSALKRAGSITINASETFSPTNSAGYITFNTTPSGSTSTSERMRITSAGNVGIGTSSPAAQLDIGSGSTSTLRLSNSDTILSLGQITGEISFSQSDLSGGGIGISGRIGMRSANRPDTGTFFGSSADMGFFVSGDSTGSASQNAPYEALTIRSNGYVGIGTTSPAQKLHVAGAIQGGTASSVSGQIYLYSNSNDTRCDLSNTGTEFKIAATYLSTGGYKPITFYTSDAERMRIDSSGNLLIGTTTSVSKVTCQNLGGDAFGAVINATGTAFYASSSGQSNTMTAAFFSTNYGGVGSITCGATTAYNTSSDYRLKDNITPMTGALAVVGQLKPCTYTWKADGSSGQGFIAHELQEVVPDCVTGEKDAVNEDGTIKAQGIDTSFLVATLTAAIQEQQAIINDLKVRIETLESK